MLARELFWANFVQGRPEAQNKTRKIDYAALRPTAGCERMATADERGAASG